jgi:hypothetical protein
VVVVAVILQYYVVVVILQYYDYCIRVPSSLNFGVK